MKNGVFISYRRAYAHFAGRIHDYLAYRGFDPFMDVYILRQGHFEEKLMDEISDCPYFLLALQKGCLDNLSENDTFCKEIAAALKCKRPEDILIVGDSDFKMPEAEMLPECIRELPEFHCNTITHEHFGEEMMDLTRRISADKISDAINWKEYVLKNGKTIISSRSVIENSYATMNNRFGRELIEAVKQGKHYDGEQTIRQIRMSCYAASIIFNPARDMVDDKAFDNGLLFNVFGELLRDPEFSLEILINAPDSPGAKVAIENNMLGNSALEEIPEAVFYGAYAGITRLIGEDPVFKEAYRTKRFRFYLTDMVMNGAIFQIEYKQQWREFDHLKYDIYSYNLTTNMDRRSMLFFRAEDTENYNHMVEIYRYLKSHRYKHTVVAARHNAWLEKWKEIQEDL